MKNQWIVIISALFFVSCYDFSIKAPDATVDTGIDPLAGGDGSYVGDPGICGYGALLCDDICVPNDVKNCGRCGHDCTLLPRVAGQVACDVNGECIISAASCAPGHANCSTGVEDGCETDITKAANCGGCGIVCPASAPNCAPKEAAGSTPAGYECRAGCPANASMLCPDSTCVNTATSPSNCGSCGNQCPESPGSQPTCQGGECGTACNEGYHDCGGKCVSNRSPETCGTECKPCKTALNAKASCDGISCGIACSQGFLSCDNQCVKNDENNCGVCGNDCTSLPNVSGSVTCKSGVCSITAASCVPGYADCNADTKDGCETKISTAQHCGSCDTVCGIDAPNCQLKAGSTTAKPVYECSLGCKSPEIECESSCVDITNNPSHCGKCNNECPQPSKTTATCSAKSCDFTCNDSGYQKCKEGCFPKDDPKNCGKCGNDCGRQKCDSSGKCVECLTDSDCGGDVCVKGTCKECDPSDTKACGKCQKCSSQGACVDQSSSEDIKNECPDNKTCTTGKCDGTGSCGVLNGTGCGKCKSCNNGACDTVRAGTKDPSGTCTVNNTTCTDGTCDSSGQCNSTSSITCYLDADGDGYSPSSSSSKKVCGTTCPNDYLTSVKSGTDCDDGEKNAFPGQTEYFSTERRGKGGYDYNCINGPEVKKHRHYKGCYSDGRSKCGNNPPCETSWDENSSEGTCGGQIPGDWCSDSNCGDGSGGCTLVPNKNSGNPIECH